jgi:CubicO group peptidase (beta-lactamase class C family)
MVLLILIAIFSITLTQCSTHKASFKGTPLNKIELLNNLEFSHEKLNNVTNYLKDSSTTTGIVMLHNGNVVYEYGNIKEVSYIASCRKSVLSILYGKHVANGAINLDETIEGLKIDEEDGLLALEKQATVNDIITSRSGVFHIPANGGYDKKNILKRGSKKPGEYFVYNNWDFNVAGYILEKQTGNSIYKEVEDQLAIPLGFQDWNIKNQKKKHSKRKSKYPAYHMYFSTRDMAKIGQLMLNEGQWEGKQLIPKDWIKKIITTVTPVDTVNLRYGRTLKSDVQVSYGYMWWLFEEFNGNSDFKGAYTASGYGGQFITVIPRLNIVIAHKTKLNIFHMLGWAYDVGDWQYHKIIEKLIVAKN